MALTLYMHPLASFCHKVLIALYENGTPFTAQNVDLADSRQSADHLARWPVGKIPVLHDDAADRVVAETSIIIEYLDQHHAGLAPMLPADPSARLDARLWDRFFDLYISVPMQKIVLDRIRPEGQGDAYGVAEARVALDTAYGMVDAHMASRHWAAGDAFGIAECAAAPGLFFASIVHPFAPEHGALAAYFERLVERPSVARVLAEARPWLTMFPYREAVPPRFLEG